MIPAASLSVSQPIAPGAPSIKFKYGADQKPTQNYFPSRIVYVLLVTADRGLGLRASLKESSVVLFSGGLAQ
jgi:hypothetical protein